MLHGCPREQNLVHHSGSGWLARPSPWGTFTSYSLPAFLADSAQGHFRRTEPVSGAFRSTPETGNAEQLPTLQGRAKNPVIPAPSGQTGESCSFAFAQIARLRGAYNDTKRSRQLAKPRETSKRALRG